MSGYFQTVSTRNAGLQILDLRLLNRGMLVVYVIFMYMSSAPLVRTMYVSEHTEHAIEEEADEKPLKSHPTRKSALAVVSDFQKTYLFRYQYRFPGVVGNMLSTSSCVYLCVVCVQAHSLHRHLLPGSVLRRRPDNQ